MAIVHLGCGEILAVDDGLPLAPLPTSADGGEVGEPPLPDPDPGPVPDATASDAGVIPEGGARVFVTSRAFTGNFDRSQNRGDEMCTALARDAGLPGAYIAFAAGRDIKRLAPSRAYFRVDGALVFDSLPSVDGASAPLVPIDLDEQRMPVAETARVWTGWIDGERCRAWSDLKGSDGKFLAGATGNPHDPAAWFRHGRSRCDADRRLYCFEW
jgi:hypothetical protein